MAEISTGSAKLYGVGWKEATRLQKGVLCLFVGLGAALLVGAIVSIVNAPDRPLIKGSVLLSGARLRLAYSFAGCSDVKAMERMIELFRKQDALAYSRFGVGNGCETLNAGDEAEVEESSAFHEAMCIRRDGDPNCLWFPAAFTEPLPVPTKP